MTSTKVAQVDDYYQEDDNDSSTNLGLYGMYTANNAKKGIPVDVQLDRHVVSTQVDTGAAVSTIPKEVYRRVLHNHSLRKTGLKLRSYKGETIPLVGKVCVPVWYGSWKHNLPLVVAKRSKPALLL